MFNNKIDRIKAFTLSEVLITLGVIGVVSTLTLPNLITAYQKKVTVTRLKSNYSIFSQAIKNSELENGEMSSWPSQTEISNLEFGEKYILPYLKDVRDAKEHVVYSLSKRSNKSSTQQSLYWFYNSSRHFYQLSNGAVFTTGTYSLGDDRYIAVDINGKDKPNIMGIDVFMFNIGIRSYYTYKKDKLSTGISSGNTIDKLVADPNIYGNWGSCNSNGGGGGYVGAQCASLIEMQGWEITKDYPW